MAHSTTGRLRPAGPGDGAPGSPSRGSSVTVAEAFDPRRNSLGALRLALAVLVAVTHATAVGFGHQPRVGGTNVSDLAVDAFFVISGFLVTRSLLRLPTLRRYAWHRFLRIMPGFWACLVVTAVLAAPLAAALTGRPPLSVFTAAQDPAWRYVVVNAALPVLQYPIAGLGGGPGSPPEVFDGALWTLKYEAACYVLLAALALAAGLRRRRWPVAVLCLLVWLAAVVHAAGGPGIDLPALEPGETTRFLLVFLLGALAHLYGRSVPVSGALVLLSGAVLAVSLVVLPDYELLGAPALAYLCVWAAIRARLPEPRWDLSYGVYVYHWPIQFLLALAGLQVVGEELFTVVALTLALGAAALSWVLVERPALGLKDAAWVDGASRRTLPVAVSDRRPGGRRGGGGAARCRRRAP